MIVRVFPVEDKHSDISEQSTVMHKKIVRKSRKEIGAAPGTLVHIGEKKAEKMRISVIAYTATQLEETEIKPEEAAKCFPLKERPAVTWVNVDGIHQVDILETLGNCCGLHPLVMEDILDTEHRPKLEDYDSYLFIVLKMLFFDHERGEIKTEQVSLVLGPNYVLSFQEREGGVFDEIRERIRNNKGRIRKMGSDYLAYALFDAIVDSYFLILERIGDQIEILEDELVTDPTPETVEKIHKFKREMILLRKSVWPLREVISGLQREESPLVQETTGLFLRDVYDHTIQVMDTVETFRDIISGMLDLYLSSISSRMNEIMKVLTIMATIFIPLTFIAGIYGMNFDYMPELKWRWGYPGVWVLMFGIVIGLFLYFKKKKWL
jgi:magnesium transporter